MIPFTGPGSEQSHASHGTCASRHYQQRRTRNGQTHLHAEVADIGDERYEGDWEGPKDDETDGDGPADGEPRFGLERVDGKVGPDDVFGCAVGKATRHAQGQVMLKALLEHMSRDLVVELNEDGAIRFVRIEVRA